MPEFIVETYGKISEVKRSEADAFYQGTLKAIPGDRKAKTISQSFQVYVLSQTNQKHKQKYIPAQT